MTKPRSLLQKSRLERYGIFDKNHGVTPLKIRNFFDYCEITDCSTVLVPHSKLVF